MSIAEPPVVHRRLPCGVELAVMRLEGRPLVAMDIRFFAGYAFEPAEHLGVAHVMDEAIVQGTSRRDGRAMNDAFDAIGATHGSYAGRETSGFSCLCLPEFLEEAVKLHSEMIRTPSFPEDACEVAVELTRQALAALGDDPGELAKKLLHRQAYGDPLGRHPLGEAESLDRITRAEIVAHWKRSMQADQMFVAVAGPVEADAVADLFERVFGGLAPTDDSHTWATGRDVPNRPEALLEFQPTSTHHERELEQSQIALCFPGCAATDADFPVEQVVLGVLAGGMSGRLFTEVREKQGLVYWVGAWGDYPRHGGMIHLGASTTPQRVEQTYLTLLNEVSRLREDLTDQEVQRAITGLVSRVQTRGDVTRAKAGRLADDLFYYGRPLSIAERIARIQKVTVADVKNYLDAHPRDRLSVVTLGRGHASEA